ncbi:hypothetical protein POM88_037441 [Heracleum sosnowskyi]|uniref:Uncharacterized protein n=1 Tax=Heracleum sosnowskyi TaxID=360622 RepID=A0AAD8HQ58_9APIA|nr:hypothetical protein POM88_037441 [Heracleum sosnowskyi]
MYGMVEDHPFIKKFKDKDIDLAILVEGLDPPVNFPKLIYTNSGGAILALACNVVHKFWKWQRNERFRMFSLADLSGHRTALVAVRNCLYLLLLGNISQAMVLD